MNWIKVIDQLPPEGRWVLAHVARDNWRDEEDPDGVYYKVVRLHKGISQAERAEMKAGRLPDPEEIGLTFCDNKHQIHYAKRSDVHRSCDECYNNLLPYNWEEFGPGQYFGQEIDFWMPLPRLKADQ